MHETHNPWSRSINAHAIDNVVQSLTVLDVDVTNLEERLAYANALQDPLDAALCLIDISCCIIDCSDCSKEDLAVYTNPEYVLEGFVFRLPEESENPDAPVYYIPESSMADTFAIAHQNLRAPAEGIEAKLLGLAGEMLEAVVLERYGIATTAPVVSLAPAFAR